MGWLARLFGKDTAAQPAQQPDQQTVTIPDAPQAAAVVGLQGQPVTITVGPTQTAHSRNRARVHRLQAAIAVERRPEKLRLLRAELEERLRYVPRGEE